MKQKKLISALKEFFGYREGFATLPEFSAECKALTNQDRLDFVGMFAGEGIEITNINPDGSVNVKA